MRIYPDLSSTRENRIKLLFMQCIFNFDKLPNKLETYVLLTKPDPIQMLFNILLHLYLLKRLCQKSVFASVWKFITELAIYYNNLQETAINFYVY